MVPVLEEFDRASDPGTAPAGSHVEGADREGAHRQPHVRHGHQPESIPHSRIGDEGERAERGHVEGDAGNPPGDRVAAAEVGLRLLHVTEKVGPDEEHQGEVADDDDPVRALEAGRRELGEGVLRHATVPDPPSPRIKSARRTISAVIFGISPGPPRFDSPGSGGYNPVPSSSMFQVPSSTARETACPRQRGTWNLKPGTHPGEVTERSNVHAWKACVGETPPRVRIPPSPPRRSALRGTLRGEPCTEPTEGRLWYRAATFSSSMRLRHPETPYVASPVVNRRFYYGAALTPCPSSATW